MEDKLQLNAGEIIGDYNITYKKASRFIYRTRSHCEGYQIRRKNWNSILEHNDFIGNAMRKKIKKTHIRLEHRIEIEKGRELKKAEENAFVD